MDRADLDVARLAGALVYADGGTHSPEIRRSAYRRAQQLYSALEEAQVTETSLAMAIHGAWCADTRGARFHEWSYHRPEAGDLLAALADPGLDGKLGERAAPDDPTDRLDEQP